jgi:hypothetical protein
MPYSLARSRLLAGGFLSSFPAWWVWLGVAYLVLIGVLVGAAFLFAVVEEAEG